MSTVWAGNLPLQAIYVDDKGQQSEVGAVICQAVTSLPSLRNPPDRHGSSAGYLCG